jgi:hypothetical protein
MVGRCTEGEMTATIRRYLVVMAATTTDSTSGDRLRMAGGRDLDKLHSACYTFTSYQILTMTSYYSYDRFPLTVSSPLHLGDN